MSEPHEAISIDSDSDNSTDGFSTQDVILDESSNSNSNFNGFSQANKMGSSEKDNDEIARFELKKLSLDKHGTFMADFDPEKSQREIRKMNRRLNKQGSKRKCLYNERGIMLENELDLCDCLEKDCPGCHFPCPRCGSGKCGTDCRCNRKFIIDYIDVEGTDKRIHFAASKK